MSVAHSTLTGSELHESKGAAAATLGQVAVANGSGGAPFGTLLNGSVPTGWPVQVTSTNYDTAGTVTANIPVDNSIPQITEGAELFTHSHTPKSATNILEIEVIVYGHVTTTPGNWTVAVFQDATAAAIAAGGFTQNSGTQGDGVNCVVVRHKMTAGGTSAISFSVRAGENSSGTLTVNGNSGARLYGGVLHSGIKITEYKAS
jgi:hypothetical protein